MKENDIFGNTSPIQSFYQNNYFRYDKNIKIGLSIVFHGNSLQFGKNEKDLKMEVVQDLENKIKVKPKEIIKFEDFNKIEQIFFVPIKDIGENPFSAHNISLYKMENEVMKYVEPKIFEYENNDDDDSSENNYQYMITLNNIIIYIISLLLL